MKSDLFEKVKQARDASLILGQVPSKIKNMALMLASESVIKRKNEILASNKTDIENSKMLLEKGEITKSIIDRLKLDEPKIEEISRMISSVAKLKDPVGQVLFSVKLDERLKLFKVTVPFGVVVSIFESRPDALPQIASLCVKSGNSVILKGGIEALESNRKIFEIIYESFVDSGLPAGCLQLVEGRETIKTLLKMDEMIDLIIPRGSNEFVMYIQENTRIPVLGHSSGICHIFVDYEADLNKAVRICVDARVQYPAACNSMKILLVDSKIADVFIPLVAKELIEKGVRIKGCQTTISILSKHGFLAEAAEENDWRIEYLDLTLPIKVVKDLDEAIEHINRYGSKHTDAIITENMVNARKFIRSVDSASVFHNASTRFSDGYRYGLGAEVGISTNKIHARGPVGLEGLVTTKYLLIGDGHIVSDYVGKNARQFLHKKIDRDLETWLK